MGSQPQAWYLIEHAKLDAGFDLCADRLRGTSHAGHAKYLMTDLFFDYIQTDIAGHCESNYTVLSQANKGVTISRTKNLLACTGRNSHSSPIQATPYSSTSNIQSIPLLR